MRRQRPVSHLILCALMLTAASAAFAQIKPGRDPNQPLDDEYTRKIREYTTEPFFLSPLVDYLPASKSVPTPKAVLGDVAGAPVQLEDLVEVQLEDLVEVLDERGLAAPVLLPVDAGDRQHRVEGARVAVGGVGPHDDPDGVG